MKKLLSSPPTSKKGSKRKSRKAKSPSPPIMLSSSPIGESTTSSSGSGSRRRKKKDKGRGAATGAGGPRAHAASVELAVFDRSSGVWSALEASFLSSASPLHRMQWEVGAGSNGTTATAGSSSAGTTPVTRRRPMAASSPVSIGTTMSSSSGPHAASLPSSPVASGASLPPLNELTAAAGNAFTSSASASLSGIDVDGGGGGGGGGRGILGTSFLDREPGSHSIDLSVTTATDGASSSWSFDSKMAHTWHMAPFVYVCVLVCEDTDVYKSKERGELRAWVKQQTDANHEWCILHLASPSTAAKGRRAPSSLSRNVWSRLRSDFNAERCCQLTVAGLLEERPDVAGVDWSPFVGVLRQAIQASFASLVARYSVELRRLELQRSVPGWNFCYFFCVKEGLSFAYERARLLPEAIKQYIELEALFFDMTRSSSSVFELFMDESSGGGADGASPEAPAAAAGRPAPPSVSWLDESSKPYRDLIYKSQISLLDFRRYLHARQCKLLFEMGDWQAAAQKTAAFVQLMLPLFSRAHIQSGLREIWAINGCLEVARAIEQHLAPLVNSDDGGVAVADNDGDEVDGAGDDDKNDNDNDDDDDDDDDNDDDDDDNMALVAALHCPALGDLYSLARALLQQLGVKLGFLGGAGADNAKPVPPVEGVAWCASAARFHSIWRSTARRAILCFDRVGRVRSSARESLAFASAVLGSDDARPNSTWMADHLLRAADLYRRDHWPALHSSALALLARILPPLSRWYDLARVAVHSADLASDVRGGNLSQNGSDNLAHSLVVQCVEQMRPLSPTSAPPPLATGMFHLLQLHRDAQTERLMATVHSSFEVAVPAQSLQIMCGPVQRRTRGARRRQRSAGSPALMGRRTRGRRPASDETTTLSSSADETSGGSYYYWSSGDDSDSSGAYSYYSGNEEVDDGSSPGARSEPALASSGEVGGDMNTLNLDGSGTVGIGLVDGGDESAADAVVTAAPGSPSTPDGGAARRPAAKRMMCFRETGEFVLQPGANAIVVHWDSAASDSSVWSEPGRFQVADCRLVLAPGLSLQQQSLGGGRATAPARSRGGGLLPRSVVLGPAQLRCEASFEHSAVLIANMPQTVKVMARQFSPATHSVSLELEHGGAVRFPAHQPCAVVPVPPAGSRSLKINETGDLVVLTPLPVIVERASDGDKGASVSFSFDLSAMAGLARLQGQFVLRSDGDLPIETRVPFSADLSFSEPFKMSARVVAGDGGARRVVALSLLNCLSYPLVFRALKVLGDGADVLLDRRCEPPVELEPDHCYDQPLILNRPGDGLALTVHVEYEDRVSSSDGDGDGGSGAQPKRFVAEKQLAKRTPAGVEINLIALGTGANQDDLDSCVTVGERLDAVVQVHRRPSEQGMENRRPAGNRFVYEFAPNDQDQRFWLVTGRRRYHFELKPGETRQFECQLFPLAAGRLELPLVHVFRDPGILLNDDELEGAPAKILEDDGGSESREYSLLGQSYRRQVAVSVRQSQTVELKKRK